MTSRRPKWFQRICEDAERRTEDRPEWRRHPEAVRDLQRLDTLLAQSEFLPDSTLEGMMNMDTIFFGLVIPAGYNWPVPRTESLRNYLMRFLQLSEKEYYERYKYDVRARERIQNGTSQWYICFYETSYSPSGFQLIDLPDDVDVVCARMLLNDLGLPADTQVGLFVLFG